MNIIWELGENWVFRKEDSVFRFYFRSEHVPYQNVPGPVFLKGIKAVTET